ncbi:MAG: hypothetical protein LAT68_11890 [Cyclobacteriaceae bacterium]|nr:hypothetical protein [Cyclobacteriaceae bacterium]MCH8517017.1 hypothetical protein [Cyclobacteriaceae bacterium]
MMRYLFFCLLVVLPLFDAKAQSETLREVIEVKRSILHLHFYPTTLRMLDKKENERLLEVSKRLDFFKVLVYPSGMLNADDRSFLENGIAEEGFESQGILAVNGVDFQSFATSKRRSNQLLFAEREGFSLILESKGRLSEEDLSYLIEYLINSPLIRTVIPMI